MPIVSRAQVRLLLAVAALIVAFTALPGARGQRDRDTRNRETEEVNRTLAFPARGTFELHNFSGDVTITGTNSNEVVIRATRRATREALDHVKLEIEQSGSVVRVEANRRDPGWRARDNDVVDTTFEIQIPASAELDVDVFSSDVDVRGVRGEVYVKTFSGNVVVDATAAGETANVSAKTFSGDIRARVVENVKGRVNFDTFSGRLDTPLALSLGSFNRKRVSGTIAGGGDGRLDFHTFSGNVRIER